MTALTGTKSALASLTVWGAITTLLSAFLPSIFTILGADPNTTAQYIVAVIGFGVTVYGRIRATQTVTVTGTPATTPTV